MNPQQPPPPRPQQPWGQQQHPPQGPQPGMRPRPMPGQPMGAPRPPATSGGGRGGGGGGVPPPRPFPSHTRPGMPHPRPMGGPPSARPQGHPQQHPPAPHSVGPRPPGYPPGAPAGPYQRPPQPPSGPGMAQRPIPPAAAPVVSTGVTGPAQMSSGAPPGPQFISPMDNVANQMTNMHVDPNVPGSPVAHAPRSKRVYAQGLTAAPPVSSQGLPQTYTASPSYNHQGGPPAPGPNLGPVGPGQPQPSYPHPSGPVRPPGYDQPKQRIDPDKIPSPVQVHEKDQSLNNDSPYLTSLKTNVPLATTQFRAVDEGNANPRFVRMTMYNLPNTSQLLENSQLPMGMVVQPLAPLRYDEMPIPVVNFGEKGPIRCGRCRAYINPYMPFTYGGRKFVCNLCDYENEVPPEYFYNLDVNGRRQDWEMRPELRYGSVEFEATKEFVTLTPTPLSYVFAIDVSWNAVQNGMVEQCALAIKRIFYKGDGLHPGTKIALVTYDKTVHFYNLSPELEQAQMLVCADMENIFVPMHHGFLVDPQESREVIESLLESLSSMFSQNRVTESAMGAMVQACQLALKKTGGKLLVFQASLPANGPGALKLREETKLFNTDKERTLFAPQNTFYPNLAEKCVESGVSVNMYLFPTSPIDAATLSSLSSITGGDTYFYPNFKPGVDGHRFGEDLKLDLTREHGFNAVMRVRCSDGLHLNEYFGNFFMRNNTDVELAGIDSDKAIGVSFRHDGTLDRNKDAYFQIALLYTTATGMRRIRVHNLAIPINDDIGQVYRNAEMDTSLNLLAKMAVADTLSKPLKAVRDRLSEKCVQVLTSYRRHCAIGSSPAQLILPEAYKLMPLYVLALMKTTALRPIMTTVDSRVASMRMLKSINVQQSASLFYPRIVPIHQLAPDHGQYDEQGHMKMPGLIRASYSRLEPTGAYLFENGQVLRLWLGKDISPEFLQHALGVSTLAEIDENASDLPAIDSTLSQQIRAIVDHMQSQRTRYLQFKIIRQGMGQSDLDFASLLTEDQTADGQSYVDYLCDIHRRIQMEISKSR